jgi:hypothetical protein
MPTDDQDNGRGGSTVDAATARSWLDDQLARQGITSPTISNRATLAKLAALAFTGQPDPTSSKPSRSGERQQGRTSRRTAGESRSDQ